MNTSPYSNSNNPDIFAVAAKRTPIYKQPRFWLLMGVIIFVILIMALQYFNSLRKKRGPAQPVVVANVISKDMPVYLSGLGAVTPTYSVTVRTQINGQLLQVYFKEGQTVKVGDLLAQIDPRPYEAQLLQYQGQLERDQALLANAQLDLTRYEKLWKQDSVSKQTLDTQHALVKQYEGNVKSDEGLIQATKLNLTYCRIVSPVNGRIGLRLVDPGNYVQTTDTNGIAVINTLNPITVVFTLPEDDIPQIQKQINTGRTLEVKAYDRTQTQLLATGYLLAIDSQIDPSTGTVKLKAQFANDDSTLFPSQFVNVKFLIDTIKNATVVPTAAVQYGTQGPFVFLLDNKDKRVNIRPVKVGITVGDNTVVTSGILPHQHVVIEGTDKLVDGSYVTITKPN